SRLTVHRFLPVPRPPPRPTLFPLTTLFRSWASTTAASQPGGSSGSSAIVSGSSIFTFSPVSSFRRWAISATAQRLSRIVPRQARSEEHTSELQSRFELVCRLLLEKKNRPLC